jgi:hypothetical protein
MTQDISSPSPSYLCLKLATARKTGQRACGAITYRVLSDDQRESLFITITANDGGGYFSKEIVPLAKVERCLAGFAGGQPLPSKALRGAFVGKSTNNAGFLVALLRAEGLLEQAAEAPHQYRVAGDWSDWKDSMLCADGEPYVPAMPAQDMTAAGAPESIDNDTSSDSAPEQGAKTEGGEARGLDTTDKPELSHRKGRGSKARPVGVPREQESSDARSA